MSVCTCIKGDFGNDGICNTCKGSIVCQGCCRIPCECAIIEMLIEEQYNEHSDRKDRNPPTG